MKTCFLAALLFALAPLALAQAPSPPAAPAVPEPRDFWPGKYVKLPAANVKEPAKLSYVTIAKKDGEYRIEGYEGRKFEMENMQRSLTEVPSDPASKTPLAHLGLGTATLQADGVLQIIIEVFVGEDHFYLIRAEPLRPRPHAAPATDTTPSQPAR